MAYGYQVRIPTVFGTGLSVMSRAGATLIPAVQGDPVLEIRLNATRKVPANDSGSGTLPEHAVMPCGVIRW